MLSILRVKDRFFYGWVVVGALTLNTLIMMGLNSSFGIFFRSFEDTFGLSRTVTSSILSVRMAFGCISAYLGGWAIDRYGPRLVFLLMGLFVGISLVLTGLVTIAWQLFITYSLLLAIGVGAVYVVTSSTILRWFNRRRGLAIGISGAGGGLGVVLMAPFAAFLIETLEWRNALLILGGIAWLVIMPVSQLMKKDPYDIGALPDGVAPNLASSKASERAGGQSGSPLRKVIRTSNFWLFMFIWVLMAISMFFGLTHIVPHAMDLGFSAVESAMILSLVGIGMVAGRFVTGVIAERVSAKVPVILCSILQIGALLWAIWAQELWTLYLFGLLYGFGGGGISTSTTIMVGESFSLSGIGKILGLLEIGFSVGAAAGPFLGGLIFDVTGNYALAFLMVAAAVLTEIFLVALVKEEQRETG